MWAALRPDRCRTIPRLLPMNGLTVATSQHDPTPAAASVVPGGAVLAPARLPPLHAVFQPIVQADSGAILGYEALIRGPVASPWAAPDALFRLAQGVPATIALEVEAARTALVAWRGFDLPGKLFLNFSPQTLRHLLADRGRLMAALLEAGIAPSRLVIEVTEQTPIGDAASFGVAMAVLRELGMQYALDDFGTGHANLDLLAHLSPHFVKIDKSLVRGIASCSRRLEILRALLRMMSAFGGRVIAEGIEDEDELAVVRDLGVTGAQGYYVGRPVAQPAAQAALHVRQALASRRIAVFPQMVRSGWSGITAGRLLRPAPTVSPSASNDAVLRTFQDQPELQAVAVVNDEGRPLAIIGRQAFIDRYAAPFHRELYGKKACIAMASRDPACFDQRASLEDMAQILSGENTRSLADGFVITDQGRYIGLGTGADLIRAITEVRMEAARYANPLTFLPGNIPLNQHIERLIEAASEFHACYVDLNHFKPFNDKYGYWKGDEMLKGAAAILAEACDPARDFLGHVGGDDFLVLYQSADWAERMRAAILRFNDAARAMYAPPDRAAGGMHGEDRHGRPVFFPPVSMAVGVVCVSGEGVAGLQRLGSQQIGAAAAAAKREAKRSADGMAVLDFLALSATLPA
ncbi:Putative Diguanylate cyclase (GGDEF domain) and c-di-GMP phosphodiesterase (EAL domain)) [Cupriavidus phytorum]|uniref:Diguanylate cyclase (GGDEF domain) and c-di-GMP phosphodiesterase (EAL domain) n=3 Tax=Cupriavidus TaxID=106589 RepID=A0A375CNS0_9BURK|nr:diguanylate cyclase/phosphodiesterase [Cupriavidus alkaliphilus]SOY76480.1 Putative Diguanylate cyclase (GGDEF domain) and c-di-GMP phosphodiesterase (EAL domain)) [Cupriavidus taiwanensis]